MSKKTELAVMDRIGRSIAASGVRVTRTGLEFARVDEQALQEAGSFLQTVDACSAWWWGDFLAAYCGYEVKAEEDEHGPMDEITKGDRMKQYSARYAAISGKEPKTLWHYLSTSRFYSNSSRRREELTFTHHVEARDGAGGDEAIADQWLDAAVENRWSASELRAAIRKTKRAKQEPDEPMPQTLLPMELVACRRFASAHLAKVADMDVDEARAQLVELEKVLEYIKALTLRVSSPTLSVVPTPGGKESLPRAA